MAVEDVGGDDKDEVVERDMKGIRSEDAHRVEAGVIPNEG